LALWTSPRLLRAFGGQGNPLTMKTVLTIATLSFACLAVLTAQQSADHRLAASMQRKLDHIKENGERRSPDPSPTVMTEDEINDYFVSGRSSFLRASRRCG